MALKWPLDSRVITLWVFDFCQALGLLLETLTDPLRELDRAVTSIALSSFTSLRRLISRSLRLLLVVIIFISFLLLELKIIIKLNFN